MKRSETEVAATGGSPITICHLHGGEVRYQDTVEGTFSSFLPASEPEVVETTSVSNYRGSVVKKRNR